jgi:glucokinase
MATKYYLGIDLGGTLIKLAVVGVSSEPPVFGEVLRASTPAGDAEGIVATMAKAGRDVLEHCRSKGGEVVGVGIGAPGPLNRHAGVMVNAPNLPELSGMPIRDRIAKSLGLPAVLENDANAAAWGEHVFGAARGAESMVLLTMGTGVGGGIVADGQLVHGVHDFAGEIGHMIVRPGGLACTCGQAGCLEQYASASNIARRAAAAIRQGRDSLLAETLAHRGGFSAADVNAARQRGDALAAEIWDDAAYCLGAACVSLQRLLDCQMIVLAGGLTRAGDDLLAPVRRHYAELNWRMTDTPADIVLAALGDDTGVYGAAGVAWKEIEPGA